MRLAPRWNNEDFGPGAAIAQTFGVTNKAQWDEAMRTIDTGGNNKNYLVTVTGTVSGGISFTRIHSGLKISLRGLGADENALTGSFLVADGETLILRDIALTGTESVRVEEGGSLIMERGKIGGGAGVEVYGTFTMSGGMIYGSGAGDKANKAKQGAAFACSADTHNSAKYGDGSLILEGYRVDYLDDTITGKK